MTSMASNIIECKYIYLSIVEKHFKCKLIAKSKATGKLFKLIVSDKIKNELLINNSLVDSIIIENQEEMRVIVEYKTSEYDAELTFIPEIDSLTKIKLFTNLQKQNQDLQKQIQDMQKKIKRLQEDVLELTPYSDPYADVHY